MNLPTRRSFLKSGTGLIVLPALESIGYSNKVKASKDVKIPKRMIFLAMGWGVTKETWFPDINQRGLDYELPPGLRPLKKHKKEITIIQNLQHKYTMDGHSGSTFWLTGANRYGIPGQSFHNSISVDQVAAEKFGVETRYASLQLAGRKAAGHGPGSLSWNRQGKPMTGLDSPVKLFHRLFSDDKVPLEQRQALLKKKQSVLDAAIEDAKSVKRGLTHTDLNKLDEYFQSIRDIETRISKEEAWLHIPKKKIPKVMKVPDFSIEGYEEIKLMYDLMVAAMQVDASRVFSYSMPSDTLIQSLGATITSHAMTHYNSSNRHVSESRDLAHARLLAYFIDKMKSCREVDGSSLYDNVVVTFGSNISNVHHLTNCPTLLAGRGAGIKHGRHLVMDDPKTPLCNLWLSLLNAFGVPVKSHGDSNGHIAELFA